jgi:hypothetical protein
MPHPTWQRSRTKPTSHSRQQFSLVGGRPRFRFRPEVEALEERNLLSAYSSAVLADHPVAYYRLGETSGTTAVDSSGNGNNGTYVGGVALGQPGALLPGDTDPAAGFNGSSTYVLGPSAGALDFSGTQMTLEAWIYPTAAGGIIVNKENQYEVALQGGKGGLNTIQWAVQNAGNGGGWAWIDTGFAPAMNQWSHIALVYNNGTVTTYGNGTVVGTTSNGSGAILSRPNNFQIGARSGAGQVFSGRIDEVAAYATALTSSQVLNHFYQAGEGGLTFAAPISTPSGTTSSAFQVISGDFNNDGLSDLAVADLNTNQVSILLSNGAGGFINSAVLPTGSGPYQLAAGDFNGDGHLDLAVANLNSNTLEVFLGTGTGTFMPPQSFTLPGSPLGIAVGDYNGDGKPDIAVSIYPSGNVALLLGNGDGTFHPAPGSPFAGGAGSYSAAAGDFNGDGHLDFVKANYPNSNVSVLLGDGHGGLMLSPQSPIGYAGASQTLSVAVGDFNGDGHPDLAVANYGSNTVSILLNSGTGVFTQAPGSPIVTAVNPYQVAAADFNGDGKLDLAVANYNGNNGYLTFLRGNGDGTFTVTQNLNVGQGITSVTVGDFNGDGAPDVAVGYLNSPNVLTFLNLSGTRTSLTNLPNSTAFGQSVTFTASVTPTGTGVPQPDTGSVTFYDGVTPLGTVALNAGGQAIFTTSTLSPGNHSITARYTDNSGFFHPSTSGAVTQTVQPPPTLTAVSGTLNEGDGDLADTLTLTGTNFDPNATVVVQIGALTATLTPAAGHSATSMQVQLPNSALQPLLQEEGTATISVVSVGGVMSNPLTVNVNDPALRIGAVHGPLTLDQEQSLAGSAPVLVTFTDPGGPELTAGQPAANEYQVQVSWGDGSPVQTFTSDGLGGNGITFAGGTFSFAANHVYSAVGTFNLGLTLLHGPGFALATPVPSVSVNVAPACKIPAFATTANEVFVAQVYCDLLHRTADPSMFAWSFLLDRGVSRSAVVRLIEQSSEYLRNQVQVLYLHYLHRAPDALGQATFFTFLAQGGTMEQAGAMLVGSPEYLQLHGGDLWSALQAAYLDILGRPIDPIGASFYGRLLAQGHTLAQVADSLFASAEFGLHLHDVFYQDFLRRHADTLGQNSFVTVFREQEQQDKDLIAALIGSAEYWGKVQSAAPIQPMVPDDWLRASIP